MIRVRRLGVRLLVPALVLSVAAHAARGAGAPQPTEADQLLSQLEIHYAQRLAQHRPDLAERYRTPPYNTPFVPIDEASAEAHLSELRSMLADAETLPAGARADTLRARLRREIADTGPGGALRQDPLLWLDVIGAAARAPFGVGSSNGCDRTRRATLQLRTLPEALRGAIVLMRTAPLPDPAALEDRLTRVERLLRTDLPARTEPCKESRYRAEFVEADSLAAASLAQYRHWLIAGD
ncbi:MAG: hypothetical protein ACHQU1_01830 [Gemmatimonadales bacterium]